MKQWFLLPLLVASLVVVSGAAAASAYTISVQTSSSSYYAAATATITGQVSPAPGSGTAALIRVFGPSGTLVTASQADVNGTTGLYSTSFVLGGSSSWVAGTYVVNATWGAYGPVVFSTTTFSWSSEAPTSSTTSVTTTTTAASTTQSTTTTTAQSTALKSSTTSQATTSSSTTSTSQTTSSTSTPSSAGGGIPVFPFQAVAVLVVTAMVAVSYSLLRRRTRIASRF